MFGLLATVSNVSASEPLYPNSLLNWLRIIDSDEFDLVLATDQHGYYFAIKRDSDGDVLFCKFDHSNKDNIRESSWSVRGPNGETVLDTDSAKKSPDGITITYKNASGGVVRTIIYDAGLLFPIRKHEHKGVRIIFSGHLMNGSKKVLFDEFVLLPQHAG